MLLGENFFPFLILALGGALIAGPSFALLKPPKKIKPGDLEKPPLSRSLLQIALGIVLFVWALATLLV